MIRTLLLALFVMVTGAIAAEVPAGEYKGTYTSDGGSSEGKVRTVLAKGGDAGWDCKFFFTRGDEEVSTKTVSCSVDEKALKASYEANADGTDFTVNIDASFSEDHTMAGTYKAVGTNGDVLDSGKWKASLHP